MRLWRLVAERHAADALSGDGASRYGGRWNPQGIRVVYTADSLALATVELAVHLTGARVEFIAIELDVPGRSIRHLDPDSVPAGWESEESITQPVGATWIRTARAVGLTVPSALVDARSGERNVLLNPLHRAFDRVTEVQRFTIEIDRRLT